MSDAAPDGARIIGRYSLHAEIASGGMAKVHLGRLNGPVGFARTVAIKRLHRIYARDPEFVAMFLDEARLAARIQHPNVVPIVDVVALDGELFLVLEYVLGESLSQLLRGVIRKLEYVDAAIVATIILGVLEGLHAAHEARSERGTPLGIVHRDISPQNVIVGADGVARVLDFGIAKAADQIHVTRRDDGLKGKMPYMAPEQVTDGRVDRRTDVWAASVVLWELLARRRLFANESPTELLRSISNDPVMAPSLVAPCTSAFDAIVLRGLEKDPGDRFATAREMAIAIEAIATPASARVVGAWVVATAGDALRSRAVLVEEMESSVGAGPENRPSLTVRARLAALGMEAPRGQPESSLPSLAAAVSEPTGLPRGRSAAAGPAEVDTTVEGSGAHADAPNLPELKTEVMAPSQPASAAQPKPNATPGHALRNAIVVMIALALVVLVVVLRFRPSSTSSATDVVSPRSTAVAQSALPAAIPSAIPSATASGDPSPSAVSNPAPSPSPSAARTPAVRHHPAAPPRLACNPPYTVGPAPDFIRHPRPECFPR